MANISTVYMGLELKNPLIVASCDLTSKIEQIKKCEEAGAGAVVLKSLFEEQIETETEDLIADSWLPNHTEAFEYVRGMSMANGPSIYLDLISDAKKKTSIPIIASLNCVSPKWWIDYAKQLELSGADAIELNISVLPSNSERNSEEIEKIYFDILEGVLGEINLPVAVKIGPYFTSIAKILNDLSKKGVNGLVLFNRFYQFDIDIKNLKAIGGNPLSSPNEISNSLRWIALLSDRINCDFAATTGIYSGEDVIKQILAGAKAVEICSTLYKNGIGHIKNMLEEIKSWMSEHDYENIEDFRGKLSKKEEEKTELYDRLQYIKALNKM
ncbi:dihydroorotate dehydrogenase-like protein [candidate division WOR-3 bacterium]|nr:dihydroorotate dehydrogenase-like protein [candidate division WOR-3 bacterium]